MRRFPLLRGVELGGSRPAMPLPSLAFWRPRMGVDRRILGLVATVIECCERRDAPGPGHPPAARPTKPAGTKYHITVTATGCPLPVSPR
jgi:hypothetical protein